MKGRGAKLTHTLTAAADRQTRMKDTNTQSAQCAAAIKGKHFELYAIIMGPEREQEKERGIGKSRERDIVNKIHAKLNEWQNLWD